MPPAEKTPVTCSSVKAIDESSDPCQTMISLDSMDTPRALTRSIVSLHNLSEASTNSRMLDGANPAATSISRFRSRGCNGHSKTCFQYQLVVRTYFRLRR